MLSIACLQEGGIGVWGVRVGWVGGWVALNEEGRSLRCPLTTRAGIIRTPAARAAAVASSPPTPLIDYPPPQYNVDPYGNDTGGFYQSIADMLPLNEFLPLVSTAGTRGLAALPALRQRRQARPARHPAQIERPATPPPAGPRCSRRACPDPQPFHEP